MLGKENLGLSKLKVEEAKMDLVGIKRLKSSAARADQVELAWFNV